MPPSGFDWGSYYFDPESQWDRQLRQIARRRFARNETLAEEAFTYAFDHLCAEDWRRLQAFSGIASREGFLKTTFRNLLEDFARERYGRPRPPEWLKTVGGLWMRLYQMLCIERLDRQMTVELLATEVATPSGEVRDMITRIRREIPNCGVKISEVSATAAGLESSSPAPEPDDPEAQTGAQQTRSVLEALRILLESQSSDDAPALSAPVLEAVGESLRRVGIDGEETVLLRSVYVDGLSFARAGARVGLPEHTARRRVDRLLERISAQLTADGFDRSDLSLASVE